MTTTFRTTADAIAYALGEPPERVEWAVAYVEPSGETTYSETGEEDARWEAEQINLGALSIAATGKVDRSHPVRAYPVYREHQSLSDGTQIISPWREAE